MTVQLLLSSEQQGPGRVGIIARRTPQNTGALEHVDGGDLFVVADAHDGPHTTARQT